VKKRKRRGEEGQAVWAERIVRKGVIEKVRKKKSIFLLWKSREKKGVNGNSPRPPLSNSEKKKKGAWKGK